MMTPTQKRWAIGGSIGAAAAGLGYWIFRRRHEHPTAHGHHEHHGHHEEHEEHEEEHENQRGEYGHHKKHKHHHHHEDR
jgi:hypothetical protein